jgi:phosphopantetheine--protein transferase-like protein
MRIATGCDLIHLPTFAEAAKRGGQVFLDKIFSPQELRDHTDTENLAGVFAAKEAVMKALDLPPGSWQQILVTKKPSDRPQVTLQNQPDGLESADISISHDGDYAMAVATILFT